MRRSGVLLPIFSLPSPYGIGDFGPAAYHFVDFLKKAGQSIWQILPLNPTSYGDSPYQSFSTFAGNPYFISPEKLIEEGLLTREEALSYDFGKDPEQVDYGALYQNRLSMLGSACARFQGGPAYDDFCRDNAWWLEDYALFMVIKNLHEDKGWNEWEEPARLREASYLSKVREENASRLRLYSFIQYEFFRQWTALKSYANEQGIQIMGDLPIYVAYDSADVWSHPEIFQLDGNLQPTSVAGVPPDLFSKDGQLWGNPLYRWDAMASREEGHPYEWWVHRICFALKLYDVLRIDHFRGFAGYFAVPFGHKTARKGRWKKGPGMDLFNVLNEKLGPDLPIVAENLGVLTPDVYELLEKTGYPGMEVLQFAFDTQDSEYLPHHYTQNCVVYTGTHDNDTILGWAQTAPPYALSHARQYMDLTEKDSLNWAMIRLAMASTADTCVVMMQDLLGLGTTARINTPSTLGQNWIWRVRGECVNDWLAGLLKDMTQLYARLPGAQAQKTKKIDPLYQKMLDGIEDDADLEEEEENKKSPEQDVPDLESFQSDLNR